VHAFAEFVEAGAGVTSQTYPVQDALPDGHSENIITEHIFYN
jgi:hypothetical protein